MGGISGAAKRRNENAQIGSLSLSLTIITHCGRERLKAGEHGARGIVLLRQSASQEQPANRIQQPADQIR
jgi:hypothetical protein